MDHLLPGGFDRALANADATFNMGMGLLEWEFDEAEVKRITQPVPVVLGGGVVLSPRFEETYQFLLNRLPNVAGFVLPSATHFRHLETPEAARNMAKELASFWTHHPQNARNG